MTTDRLVKKPDFKKVLVDICAVFTVSSWEEIQEKTNNIDLKVDRENQKITFCFEVAKDKKNKYFSKTLVNNFLYSSKNRYSKWIEVVVDGFRWRIDEISGVIKEIVDVKDLRIRIEGDSKVTLLSEQDTLLHENYSFLSLSLQYLFKREIILFIETLEKKEEIKEQEKPVPEKYKKTGNNIEGDFCCFKLESRVDTNGSKKHKAGFSDLDNFYWLSIASKGDSEAADNLFNKLKVNKWYRCNFSLNKNSRFADSLDGFLNEAELLEDHEEGLGQKAVKDEYEHGIIYGITHHTKNSAFDGLYTVKEIVKEAVDRGHNAVGLADLGSVQSFAEFEKEVTKAGIKGLYGVELEIVQTKTPILQGGYANNWLETGVRIGDTLCKDWNGVHYTVLDIETTGLYPGVDEIVQIAAKKYYFIDKCLPKFLNDNLLNKNKNNKVDLRSFKEGFRCVEEFERYVRGNKPVGSKIVELTGITEEIRQEKGKDVKAALLDLKTFLKGSVLVVHNGIDFDIPFLNAHLKKNNIEEIEESVIDTLKLSQYLFKKEKFKSHALAALVKKANIHFDEEKAHNATYDVEILHEVFFSYLIPNLKERDKFLLENLKEINNYFWNKEEFNSNVWGEKALVYIKNQKGVKDLYELVSLAHTKYYFNSVKLYREELNKKRRENLIVVSDPLDGELIEALLKDDRELFRNLVNWYDYVTIPPTSHFLHEEAREYLSKKEVKETIRKFVKWCEEDKAKWFFSSAIRYIDKKRDKERYAVLVNTKGILGKRHYLYEVDNRNDQMPDLEFKYTKDLLDEYKDVWEEAVLKGYIIKSIRTNKKFVDEIDEKIEVYKKKLHPPRIENCSKLLREVCEKKLKEKYGEKVDKFLINRYETEIQGIIENGFSVIYWVSHLLVKESVREGYLVGSRGSVGSSFVAYLANISEVNPLPPHYYCTSCSVLDLQEDWKESGFDLPEKKCSKCGKKMEIDGHDIPFETFLGFGGNKVPDIDLNFSGEYQNKAHNFLLNYFGEDRVFRAGTISTMAEKTAVAVVLEYRDDMNIKNLNKGKKVWLVDKIVDVKRTTGQHPGGILVVPDNLSIYDFSPINYPANDTSSDWYTTHFAFEDLHDALLKFDILGHDDPTILKLLKELTNFDPVNVPCQDSKLVELYRSCEVMGIEVGELLNAESTGALGLPEFGTVLTRRIIKVCQPTTFADLMRISGFSHGTGVWKGNIEVLVKGEDGYPLNRVITCRDDIMLYLLSVGLSRKDAFNITESIRKGRGLSPDMEEIMKDKGVPDWYIQSSKKITYIFPKAHATAYVIMSWKIAYYKLYYPLAFYSSYFTTSVDHFDLELLLKNDTFAIKEKFEQINKNLNNPAIKAKVNAKDKARLVVYEVAYEFLLRGFKFTNVCVNKSELDLFVPIKETKELRIPLKAVDGLGEQSAKSIIEGRRKGYYKTLEDLNERGGIKRVAASKLQNFDILPKGVDLTQVIFDGNGDRIV